MSLLKDILLVLGLIIGAVILDVELTGTAVHVFPLLFIYFVARATAEKRAAKRDKDKEQ